MNHSLKKAHIDSSANAKQEPFNQLLVRYIDQINLHYQSNPIVQRVIRETKASIKNQAKHMSDTLSFNP